MSTRLINFILNKLCRKIVVQGPLHKSRITDYYRSLRRAVDREFTEDNAPTLEAFLQECFNEANKSPEEAAARAEWQENFYTDR